MKTLPERLIYARTRLDMSQGEVAKAVGMKQPSYGQIESGETKKSKFIYDIAKILKVSPEWLIDGIGEMSTQPLSDKSESNAVNARDEEYVVIGGKSDYPLVNIPYLDLHASCGGGYANADHPEQKGFIAFTVEFLRENGLPLDGDGLMLMHSCGESMGYTIPHGTLMLVNRKENQFDNFLSDKIYVFNADGEMMCKRSFKNLDSTVTLVSDNKDKVRYPDQIIDRKTFNNFNLFGRVRYTFTKL